MGFCCADCGDSEHTCTAWDGTGVARHNLGESCPEDITTCEYRKKKVKSDLWLVKED